MGGPKASWASRPLPQHFHLPAKVGHPRLRLLGAGDSFAFSPPLLMAVSSGASTPKPTAFQAQGGGGSRGEPCSKPHSNYFPLTFSFVPITLLTPRGSLMTL